MDRERLIRIIAGSFILLSLGLSQVHSPYWLLFTTFVGLNLFQAGFSKWCLMEDILKKFGVKSAVELACECPKDAQAKP